MFHLFNRVYLDNENHINSKDDMIVLADEKKEHPISRILGSNVGEIPAFDDIIKQEYSDDIEQFWAVLLAKDPGKNFVVFCGDETFFRLLIQYWKSLFVSPSDDFLFQLYDYYRIDFVIKSYSHADRGDNRLGVYNKVFLHFDKESFAEKIKSISPSITLQNSNKDIVSYEYLLANYYFNKSSMYSDALRRRVLSLAWGNWCTDIEELKAEVIRGIYNIDSLFPDLKIDENYYIDPISYLKNQELTSWLFDSNIKPDNSSYIVRKYKKEFFPYLQSLVDKNGHVVIRIKGIESDDIDIFNQASQTQDLYSQDFEAIIKRDTERMFGSFFIKGELFLKVNHYLINYIYKKIRQKETQDLKNFELL